MCLSALAKNQYYHKGQHTKLSYTFAHYLRPLGRTLYHLLAPWHRTPAGKLLQLFEQTQKGAFFPSISFGSWAFVQRRRCHHCTPWNLALDLGHFFWLIWSPVFLCFLQAQVYKVYLLLIQCNKECLWAKMIDFIHSTKLADSAVDDKVWSSRYSQRVGRTLPPSPPPSKTRERLRKPDTNRVPWSYFNLCNIISLDNSGARSTRSVAP